MIALKRSNVSPLALALLGPFSLNSAVVNPTPAAARQVVSQSDDAFPMRIGAVTVVAPSDGWVHQDLHRPLQYTTPAQTDELPKFNFQANPVEASINAYLIQLPGKLVLIDIGSDELFGPSSGGDLLASLSRAAFRACRQLNRFPGLGFCFPRARKDAAIRRTTGRAGASGGSVPTKG